VSLLAERFRREENRGIFAGNPNPEEATDG
jgi:hypothetical protein